MNGTPQFGTLNYAILSIYLAAMFGIGLFLAGRQKTTEDYFLAGRKMPWLIVAMSMFASLTSAVSYMGVPGIAYKENIAMIVLGIMSLLVAPFLILLFYPFYHRLNVTTSYEYIARRYGAGARYATSGLFVAARLGWLGVVIYAPALALSVVAGVNLYLAIGLMGMLAVAYTTLGGLSAVLWTDFLQFVFLVGGAIWVALTLILSVPDGFSGILEIAQRTDHLRVFDLQVNIYEMTGIVVAVSYFFQLMHDYGADQVTVQRLMAVKSFRGKAKAILFNSCFDMFIMSLLLFVGLGMFAYYQHFPDRLPENLTADRMLPYYIMHALPNGISGILITAIFAAAMSSMDSGINSLSTVIVNDFVKPLRRRARTETQDVNLARLLTLVLGVFAVAVACYVSTVEHILKASSAFLGLFSGPILALFLLGILTRRASFRGWLVGVALAMPATIWLQYGVGAHFIYYFPFCFGICFLTGYPASVLLGGPKAPSELTLWGRSQLEADGGPAA